MCGIVGIVRRSGPVVSDLIKSLKKLEYRGYDSAGLAVLEDEIRVIKGVGTIDEVVKGRLEELGDGSVGIGHTRWATHGGVSESNAHPILSCDGNVAVVHNGTLDDFYELRDELSRRGHVFSSDTDTEIIAHLIEEELRKSKDILTAFSQTISRLKGSYAIASIIRGRKALLLARYKSPLVIGLGDGENYAASDITALLHLTNRFIFLDDGEIALVTPDNVKIWRLEDQTLIGVSKRITEVSWTPQLLDKGNYPHFMIKEIYEQPSILREISESASYYLKFSQELRSIEERGNIYIVAAGTSYHAGLIGKFYLSKLVGMGAEVIVASEFPEWSGHVGKDDLVLAISQSGETMDVLEAVRVAKSKGARIFSIVNVPGSTLVRLSDDVAFIRAGPEIGVAATKTFTAQVAVLYLIASILKDGSFEDAKSRLGQVAVLLDRETERMDRETLEMSDLLVDQEHAFFLGRGVNYPTALEGALKLKEISYIHAEGYPAGEYKHGPLALIDEGTPAMVIVPVDEGLRNKIIYNIMEVRSRGAKTITLGPRGVEVPCDHCLELDVEDELLSPLVYSVPLQLLAYHTAVKLGRNPDKPRNLAKSVTVE